MAIKVSIDKLDLSKISEDELQTLQRKIRAQQATKKVKKKKAIKIEIPNETIISLKNEYLSLKEGIEVKYDNVSRYCFDDVGNPYYYNNGSCKEIRIHKDVSIQIEAKQELKARIKAWKKVISQVAKQYHTTISAVKTIVKSFKPVAIKQNKKTG